MNVKEGQIVCYENECFFDLSEIVMCLKGLLVSGMEVLELAWDVRGEVIAMAYFIKREGDKNGK